VLESRFKELDSKAIKGLLITVIIVVITGFALIFYTQKQKLYYSPTIKDEFFINVTSKHNKRGATILNDSTLIPSNLPLIGFNKNYGYNKLEDSLMPYFVRFMGDFSNVLRVEKVVEPYQLSKPANSNLLILVRGHDTLNFWFRGVGDNYKLPIIK
jgi:hypothetical protein